MMDNTNTNVDELTPRELGLLIERAGDALHNHEDSTDSMKALGDASAEIGNKVVAIDGKRVEY